MKMSHLTSGAFLTKIFSNFCHPQELFSTTTSSNSHQKRERQTERERASATIESVRRGGEFQKAKRERERGNERACVRLRPTVSEPVRTKANITSFAFPPLIVLPTWSFLRSPPGSDDHRAAEQTAAPSACRYGCLRAAGWRQSGQPGQRAQRGALAAVSWHRLGGEDVW